jgi:predicted RND superfamily exporter protein
MITDLGKSLTVAAAIMFGMMWIGFGSLRLALVSIVPNAFPLLTTAALIVLSGRWLEMGSVIVFSIALGIAVDDTIHFLARFKREMRHGPDPPAAIARTMGGVGVALVTTTVLLLAGHAAVLCSVLPVTKVFGGFACAAIVSALVGDLVILPAMLACFWAPGGVARKQN